MSVKQDIINSAIMEMIQGGKEQHEMHIAMGVQKMAQNIEGLAGALNDYKERYPMWASMDLANEDFEGFEASLHGLKQMFDQVSETCDAILKDMGADKKIAPVDLETPVDGEQ